MILKYVVEAAGGMPFFECVRKTDLEPAGMVETWAKVPAYIEKGMSTSLLYSMTAFVAMSIILTKTKIIDSLRAAATKAAVALTNASIAALSEHFDLTLEAAGRDRRIVLFD